jgi:uncharacterized protein (TIGR00251 family)
VGPDRISFRVRAVPRASRTEAAGVHGDALRVRLAAPPVDGEANDALTRFLARALGVSRSAVTLAKGASGRSKVVEVVGDTHALREALASLTADA